MGMGFRVQNLNNPSFPASHVSLHLTLFVECPIHEGRTLHGNDGHGWRRPRETDKKPVGWLLDNIRFCDGSSPHLLLTLIRMVLLYPRLN